MKTPKIENMTLREKIGQTVIFYHMLLEKLDKPGEYFNNNVVGATWPMGHPKEVYKVIETEYGNPELLGRKDDMYINMVNYMNKHMSIPVMPAMDAANGIPVSKFEGHGELPTNASLGAVKDPELAYRYANVLGKDFRSIGLRWIWSPVADNAGHFHGTRVMSCNTEDNCKLLSAFVKGMQDAGVAAGAKHFPGPDPYDSRDSHFCTASYSQSFEYWEKTQMREFQACIDAGVASIMVGHRTFKAVDDTRVNGALLPATLSYKIVTELLKGKMGFDGVVITDGVDMKALTAIYEPEKLYVELLRAGIDMVLGPTRLDYIDIVEKAVLAGDLPESRIDDACRRILKMKEKYGVFEDGEIPHPTEEQREQIKAEMAQVATEISERGITLCANRTNFLPLKKENIKKVKIVYIGYSELCYENLQYAVEQFEKYGAKCDIQNGFEASDNDTLDEYDLIVYATFIGFFAPAGGQFFFGKECHMMRKIMTTCTEKSIAVSFGNTDIFFNYFTASHTFINAYSYNRETMVSFVKGLYGDVQFTDYNPFPLNPITRTDDVYQ